MADEKRSALRHLLAAVWYRGKIALAEAPDEFTNFRAGDGIRTPAEILAHIGDLIAGSHCLLKGELVYLNSEPLPWNEDIERFRTAVLELDSFLAGDEPLRVPVEKLMQGPIGDALTHVGQIVMLRRMFGAPIAEQAYFQAGIIPGVF